MVATEIHSIPAAAYMKELTRRLVADYWVVAALPIIALGALSIFDLRWLIVLLMTLFIIAPMTVLFVYIWHGMKPELRYSLLSKTISLTAEGIEINYTDDKHDLIPWQRIARARRDSKHISLTFTDSRYTFLLIPLSAFSSCDDAWNIITRHIVAA